jgi:uncharacterized protein with ParB-like and HNH nuclease domain
MAVSIERLDNLTLNELDIETIEEIEQELAVDDEASKDDMVVPERFDITSFGADYDVEGLVRRLQRGDIYIPSFQRGYVWNQRMASRFIESLLLGLPVPGIFLAREQRSNKLVVIDGQQRLKTLKYFYEGYFNPKDDDKTQRVFKLMKVQRQFENQTYATLVEEDRLKLNDSILHATIVKQEAPPDDDTSVYHIFERLNNGGLKLAPQEIRTTIYHGDLVDLLKRLNDYESWRGIFGKKSARLKDQELILRFLSFYFDAARYERPMEEFLNRFARRYQQAPPEFLSKAEHVFKNVIDTVFRSIGEKAFRPERALNAAVFDSVMVGIARRLDRKPIEEYSKIRAAYQGLLDDEDYLKLISQSTAPENNVNARLDKATEAFAEL